MFWNFYLVKNHKVALTQQPLRLKKKQPQIWNFRFFGACLTKFNNNQILLNKIGYRFLLTTKFFSGWKSLIPCTAIFQTRDFYGVGTPFFSELELCSNFSKTSLIIRWSNGTQRSLWAPCKSHGWVWDSTIDAKLWLALSLFILIDSQPSYHELIRPYWKYFSGINAPAYFDGSFMKNFWHLILRVISTNFTAYLLQPNDLAKLKYFVCTLHQFWCGFWQKKTI